MVSWLLATPGRLYVVATLLPLAAFALLLVGGCLRTCAGRTARRAAGPRRLLRPRRRSAAPGRGVPRDRGHRPSARFCDRRAGQVPRLTPTPVAHARLEQRWAERTDWVRSRRRPRRRPAGRRSGTRLPHRPPGGAHVRDGHVHRHAASSSSRSATWRTRLKRDGRGPRGPRHAGRGGSAGSSCTCRCSASRCSTCSSRTTCSRCSSAGNWSASARSS